MRLSVSSGGVVATELICCVPREVLRSLCTPRCRNGCRDMLRRPDEILVGNDAVN